MVATSDTIHLVFKEPLPREKKGCFGRPTRTPELREGGGDGTRTHDRLVANQVLYQLSYAPECQAGAHGPEVRLELTSRPARADIMVGLSGLEPLTSRLSGGRSNQLSYKPEKTEAWGEIGFRLSVID